MRVRKSETERSGQPARLRLCRLRRGSGIYRSSGLSLNRALPGGGGGGGLEEGRRIADVYAGKRKRRRRNLYRAARGVWVCVREERERRLSGNDEAEERREVDDSGGRWVWERDGGGAGLGEVIELLRNYKSFLVSFSLICR